MSKRFQISGVDISPTDLFLANDATIRDKLVVERVKVNFLDVISSFHGLEFFTEDDETESKTQETAWQTKISLPLDPGAYVTWFYWCLKGVSGESRTIPFFGEFSSNDNLYHSTTIVKFGKILVPTTLSIVWRTTSIKSAYIKSARIIALKSK